MKVNKIKKEKGFTFIELIISIAVFLIFVSGIYSAYTSLYNSITVAHSKSVAVDVANEQFELIRNLSYSNVGTMGGNPSGTIPSSQTITRDGITYNINITVLYKDDPFDGLYPADMVPNDYKLVEVNVTCSTCKNPTSAVITSRFSPKGLETN